MSLAVSLANSARAFDEVPVGAIVTHKNKIIGSGFNDREHSANAVRHAEIIAIEQACKNLNSWRLTECSLFVTLEPCLMCAGALVQARIGRVVYGTPDPKGGALGSLYSLASDPRLNHNFPVLTGVLQEECATLLKSFFRSRRLKKRTEKT